jgi:hypothetical protein
MFESETQEIEIEGIKLEIRVPSITDVGKLCSGLFSEKEETRTQSMKALVSLCCYHDGSRVWDSPEALDGIKPFVFLSIIPGVMDVCGLGTLDPKPGRAVKQSGLRGSSVPRRKK